MRTRKDIFLPLFLLCLVTNTLLISSITVSYSERKAIVTGRLGPAKTCFDLKLSVGVFGVDAEKLQFISRSNFATGVANTCVFKGKEMF